jgi:DNA-binding XRE family transcriptional regulator
MLFADRIRELRQECQLPQRRLAAALDIDTATYCKIEKGERKAKKEQVLIMADMLHIDSNELLTLWIADKVTDAIGENKSVAQKAISIAVENL